MENMFIKSAVDRLAASRNQYFETLESQGDELGYFWAANQAEYIELERLANVEPDGYQIVCSTHDELLIAVIDCNRKAVNLTVPRECLESDDFCITEDDLERDEFWDGFLKGAERLYEEVTPGLSA
jgi:hypothetical protein